MTFAQPFADYEILERVGAGAMGTVFKARHKKLGRIVALKVLRPSLARNERYVDRLRREARIVASLNHPNVVTGYDLGEEGGYHFFVMEFVEGRSLRSLLAEWGMFPEDQVINVAVQVAQALDHAYPKGVIHRDVKPGNILIDDDGQVKLTDMGLAKGPTDMTLTRDGATVGTPQYISPEQARDPQSVDVRTDLYSLGATLYHMATGQPPFPGATMAEVITKVLHERAPSVVALNPHLSDGLSLVIRKLMAKDPDLRYQDPRELLDDLERVRADEVPAVDRGRLDAAEPGGLDRRRRLRWAAAAVGVAVLVLAGLAVGLSLNGGPSTVAPETAVLDELDQRLRGAIRNSARWTLFNTFEDRIPSELEGAFFQRRGEFLDDVQADLDALVHQYQGAQRQQLLALLVDPATWPDAADFIDGELTAEMTRIIDFRPGDLPVDLRRAGLDQLCELVRTQVQERDERLLAGLDAHLEQRLPGQCHALVAAGDFAGAERCVRGALGAFLDGVAHPRQDLLAPATRAAVVERHRRAVKLRLEAVVESEKGVAAALAEEARSGLSALAEWSDQEHPDPAVLLSRIDRLAEELQLQYPSAAKFRLTANPWSAVDQLFNEARRSAAQDSFERDAARLSLRLDLAYRALVRGAFRRAMELLDDVEPGDPALRTRRDRHRHTIAAGHRVAGMVLGALAEAREPLWAYRRSAPVTRVRLWVRPAGAGFDIRVGTPDGGQHRVELVDLGFANLIDQARGVRGDLLAELPAGDARLGSLLLACLSDDFSRVEAQLPAADDRFFIDQVWARIESLRREAGLGATADVATALAAILRSWQDARQSGELASVDNALASFEQRFGSEELSPREVAQLADCRTWVHTERRRRTIVEELRTRHPDGVEVEVAEGGGDGLEAVLSFTAGGLGTPVGWHLRDDALAAAVDGSARPLTVAAGLSADGPSRCSIDLSFPLRSGPPRVWLFEFGGAGLALTLLANDAVVAAIVPPGALGRPGSIQSELQAPLASAALGGRAAVATPGAVHRLTLSLEPMGRRSRFGVRAVLDEQTIARGVLEFDDGPRADLAIHPRHALSVHRIEIRAGGL